jgi:hypothetical protein
MIARGDHARAETFDAAVHDYDAAQALTTAAQEVFAAAADESRRAAAWALLQEATARRRVAWKRLRSAFNRGGRRAASGRGIAPQQAEMADSEPGFEQRSLV